MTNQPPQAKHREKQEEKQALVKRAIKSVYIPISKEVYEEIIEDSSRFRSYLESCWSRYPELKPEGLEKGYNCIGYTEPSKKQPEIKIRRIRSRGVNEEGSYVSYQLMPSFVLPYRTGLTEEVEKALYLHFKYQVSFDGLEYVFGKNAMYWYHLSQHLGRYSLVGSTAYGKADLPEHVLADEKHRSWNGKKAYVATTVAEGCIWGASLSLQADEAHLEEAYGVFKEEAQAVDAEYAPKTVNTDGFASTVAVWNNLFTSIIILRCFLHGFLHVRTKARRLTRPQAFHELATLIWNAFHQTCYEEFIDKLTILQFWIHHEKDRWPDACYAAVTKLCNRAHEYAIAYDHPSCYRTSNMLDRLMQRMDRYLFITRYFHGHLHSAEKSMRAWALAHNFLPYASRTRSHTSFSSPVHALHGFVYADNWLENLLVASSSSPPKGHTQNSLV